MTTMRLSKIFAFAVTLIIILLVGLSTPVQSKDLLPITIGYGPNQNAPIFLAWKKGYFEKVGLAPKFIKSPVGPATFALFHSKTLDVSDLGMSTGVVGCSQGLDIAFVGVPVDVSTSNCLVVRPDSGIKKLADIKGKKIGGAKGSVSYYGLAKALESVNLSLNDVKFLDMMPVSQMPAFQRGDVDGVWTWGPWENKMVRLGGIRIVNCANVGAYSPEVWACRPEWVRQKPEVLQLFLKAMEMAVKETRQDKKIAAGVLADVLEVDQELALEIINSCYYPLANEQLSDSYALSLHKGLIDAVKRAAEFLYSQNITYQVPDAEKLVDPGPMKIFIQSQK